MVSFGRCLRGTFMVLVLSAGLLLVAAYWAYKIIDEGEMKLDNAPGVVTILREKDTQIMTIRGDNWESVSYAQGFAGA